MSSKSNKNTKGSNTTTALLHQLVCKITGLSGEAATPYYQFAVTVTGSASNATCEQDEFHTVEKIKKSLIKDNRQKAATLIDELHQKLIACGTLKNRCALLRFLLELKNSQQLNENNTGFLPLFEKSPIDVTPLPQSHMSVPNGDIKRSSTADSEMSNTNNLGKGRMAALLSYWQAPPTNPSFKQQQRKVEGNSTKNDMKENYVNEIPEQVLLREVVYMFQNIEGKIIRFGGDKDDIWIDPKAGISRPTRKLVCKLVELGWLYRKVCKYCETHANDKSLGFVGKSFVAALQQELTEYYRLLAVLEAQLHQEDEQGVSTSYGGLTLRRLMVWTMEPITRMKILASLVDVCKGLKGGALMSAIHSYLQHGDSYIRTLVKNTLAVVSVPVYNMLHQWIIDGELSDTYQEFFVASNPDVHSNDQLWHEKYSLRESMVPSFLSTNQARKILSTGKCINFLRQVCVDRTSLQCREGICAKLEKMSVESFFTQDDDGELQTIIDIVYKDTSRHLLNVMFNTYKFMEHLKAMRRYLLLGQGDFIRHLMDLLESDLNKPASTLYMHSLCGILETAIQSTNAQFDDPDILKRLDVRLSEVSLNECGWDVFSLDYHMDGPIGTVFTRPVILTYLRLFNSLWRAKRMEYVLAVLWKSQMANSRLLIKIPEVGPIMQQCHILLSEMVHFVKQMQYYITFEVMECSWDVLVKKVESAEDLDQVIAAHQEFLETILKRALLDSSSSDLLFQLRATYELVIQFQNVQEQFSYAALQELDLRLSVSDRRKKVAQHQITAFEEAELQRQREFQKTTVTSTKSQLRILANSFQDMIHKFLLMLFSHTDVNLQCLSYRLDFNEHYKNRDSKLHTSLTYQHRRKSMMSLSVK